jgi:hypothetical protein
MHVTCDVHLRITRSIVAKRHFRFQHRTVHLGLYKYVANSAGGHTYHPIERSAHKQYRHRVRNANQSLHDNHEALPSNRREPLSSYGSGERNIQFAIYGSATIYASRLLKSTSGIILFRHFPELLSCFRMFEVQTLHFIRRTEWIRPTTDAIRISRCFHEDDFSAKSPPHLRMPGATRFTRKSFPFSRVFFKTICRQGPMMDQWKSYGRIVLQHLQESVIIQDGFAIEQTMRGDCEFSFVARAPQDASQVQVWAGIKCRDRDSRYVFALRGGDNDDLYLARYGADGAAKFLGIAPLEFHPIPGDWYQLRAITRRSLFGSCQEYPGRSLLTAS